MGTSSSPILSVVEHIQGQQLNLDDEEIYEPSFWIPYLPIKFPEFTRKNENTYSFHIQDTIKLDPTGTLSTNYDAKGDFSVSFIEQNHAKGAKWTFEINVETPKAIVKGAIRARNEKTGLKLGIFLYHLDSSDINSAEVAQDAIFFAIRLYLRKLLQKFSLTS